MSDDAAAAEPQVAEADEQPVPADAVIVVRVKNPDGSIEYAVSASGNIEPDMLPTVLEKGLQRARVNLGLEA